ncbi:hypothetical protein NM208_g13081 [Fusarium decemcellulare]|uniref:Uncharacterized protein n=1 Tax=Fusarium decemcellulare TaxID=57161 RepID=A0ACC1RL75_9HYPO|nr:hypothetical protein NM208_g13081 [Fusarium decemcellulare]
MRLINTKTLQIETFLGSKCPKYAILSHTWSDDEPTFAAASPEAIQAGATKGLRKVQEVCALSQRDGFGHVWVDTCCIDKTSSSELAKAINSMFKWYQQAEVCYVWLVDLKCDVETSTMESCKWFTRGWTLQELIAPRVVQFYDEKWNLRGTKSTLAEPLFKATNIDLAVLTDQIAFQTLPVARRMSWAARRETSRPEDIAYCLLGLFDVNMPMIYGEGKKAFTRLQEEIIKSHNDLSIFLWKSPPGVSFRGILAEAPSEFACASTIVKLAVSPSSRSEFIMTNKGVRIEMLFKRDGQRRSRIRIMNLGYTYEETPLSRFLGMPRAIGIWLREAEVYNTYVRAQPDKFAVASSSPRYRYYFDPNPYPCYLSKEVSAETVQKLQPSMQGIFPFDKSFRKVYS